MTSRVAPTMPKVKLGRQKRGDGEQEGADNLGHKTLCQPGGLRFGYGDHLRHIHLLRQAAWLPVGVYGTAV